ncbi:MAG TPA: hypothetical protein VGI18_05840 [Burkholderiales bacterium]|jgi:hypothetical protein
MKSFVRILLVALSLGATGAYAQSTTYNSQQQSAAKYNSQTPEGDSANWGVGG